MINVPENLRSVISYCPRGGMIGLFIKQKQLVEFANMVKTKNIDEIIPSYDTTQPEPKECPACHGVADKVEAKDTMYWETDKGSHGWCCSKCGMVVQWG